MNNYLSQVKAMGTDKAIAIIGVPPTVMLIIKVNRWIICRYSRGYNLQLNLPYLSKLVLFSLIIYSYIENIYTCLWGKV